MKIVYRKELLSARFFPILQHFFFVSFFDVQYSNGNKIEQTLKLYGNVSFFEEFFMTSMRMLIVTL